MQLLITTKKSGDSAEDAALHYLQAQGLRLVQRNYRTPGRGGGEVDLILREQDGTLVFAEVRKRTHTGFGGAGGSVSPIKQRRIIFAARTYLFRLNPLPPCRFDVVMLDGTAKLEWIKGAFDAYGY